ncbi:MAG: MFS transporter [Chthonomonadales bacterium]|nr:MFS transporter [Chthonomonadales bacterium]
MPSIVSRLRCSILLRVGLLPEATRTAWAWELVSGACAGVYTGSVWTFAGRIARADMHATGVQMGWFAAAPAVGYVFATVWARQMEGRSKLPFVYWTWLIARGLFILTPAIRTRDQYILLVCITPIIFSISSPAYTAVMKDIYPDAYRGRLMSAVRIVLNVVTFGSALIVGRLLDAGVDWRTVFCGGGVFGALSAWAFSRIRPVAMDEPVEAISTRAFVLDTFAILKRNPAYRWFTASVFVYGFGNLIAATLYPVYQVDRFHITNTEVANLQNVGAVSTIVGFFFWGSFMDRRGPLATVFLSILIICAMPIVYASAPSVEYLRWAAAAGGIALSGIELGYLNTTLFFSEPGRAAQYQALHSSLFGIRGSIAPHVAIPLMERFGAQRTFWIAEVIMLVGLLLQVASMNGYRRRASMDGEDVPV